MLRTIVVPLDGSPFGEHALPHACAIATHSGAMLRLLYVHAPSISPVNVEGEPVIDENLGSLHYQHERRYLEQIKERLVAQVSGVTVEVEVYDRPIESIVNESVGVFLAQRIAERDDIDLIVMTTHGRGGISRFWLGSVADVLVRLSNVPILLVRPSEGEPNFSHLPMHQNILVPLDGSFLAEQILEPVETIGGLITAHYTLLQVVEPIAATFGLSTQQKIAVNAHAVHKAEEYLNQLAQRCELPGDIHFRVLTSSNIAATILEDAERHDNDLIAMATHGRSGLQRLMLGSVADKVMRGSAQPVLLYRPSGRVEKR